MKCFNKIKSYSKLYFRILLYFLTFTLIILLVGLFIYAGFIRNIEKNFYDRIDENMSLTGKRIEEKIQNIFVIGSMLYNEESIIKCLRPYNMMTLDQKNNMKDIQASINRHKLMSDIIQSIFIFIDEEKVYNDNSVQNSYSFFNKHNQYKTYDQDFWMEWLSNQAGTAILPADTITVGSTMQQISVIPVVLPSYNSGYRCIMVINISVNSLYQMYYENSIFKDTNYVITDSNGILASKEDFDFILKFQESETEVLSGNENYIINTAALEQFNWKVYSFTPRKEFVNVKRYYLLISFVVCIGFLTLGIVLSYIYSRKIYIPIRTVTENLGINREDIKYKIKNNELEMINYQVGEMQKIQSKITGLLSQFSKRYIKQCIIDIVDHKPIEDQKYFENIISQEIGFKEPYYATICYVFIFEKIVLENYDMNLYNYKMSEIAEEINRFISKNRPAITVNYRKNMFISIVNLKEDSKDTRAALQKELEDTLNARCFDDGCKAVHIGIGKNVSKIYGISRSFEEACTSLVSVLTSDENCVIRYEDINILNEQKFSCEKDERLKNAVALGDFQHIETVAEQLLKEYIRPGREYTYCCAAVKNLCKTFIVIIQGEGQYIYDEDLAIDQYVDYPTVFLLSQDINIEPVMRFLSKIMTEHGKLDKTSIIHDLSICARKYVDANYMRDLSIEIIADHLGVSAKHLSRCFKNDTDMNLSDYIAHVRVNKAKELLQGSMPISQIPKQIGIWNRSTFMRIFKKLEGVSPGEYRNYYHALSQQNDNR